MSAQVGVYRPRHPENTPFYRCLDDYWEEFRRGYEVLFERVYGPLRTAVTYAVERFLKCGLLHFGFARLRCRGCQKNRYLAYSCRTRQFCPSCAAKRVAAFTGWVTSEVLEPVGHRQLVFTLPKVLPPVFRKNRKLLGKLCRCAWQTLAEMYEAAFPDEPVMGAALVAIQTAGDQLQWHPHLHGLVPDAVWTRDGRLLPIRYLDPSALTRLFRAQVLRMLVGEHCLSPQFAARLLTWRYYSGFQVYRTEPVDPDDRPALERLCAYIARPLFASTRVGYHPSTGTVSYRSAKGVDLGLDALEWIARLTQHIPDRREHTRHSYGYYSNAARGRRHAVSDGTAAASASAPSPSTGGLKGAADPDTEDFRRERRRTWARLIQRVYEVDPLICPDCGGRFEVVAFIDAPQTVRRILQHLHLWDLPARPPPAPLWAAKTEALLDQARRQGARDLAALDGSAGVAVDAPFADDVPTYTNGS